MSQKNLEERHIAVSDSEQESDQDKIEDEKIEDLKNNDDEENEKYDFYNEKEELSEKQFKLFLNIRAREFIELSNSEIIRYILSNQSMSYNELLKIIATDKKKKQAIEKLENKEQKKIEKMEDKENKLILSKEEKVLKKSIKIQKEQKIDNDDCDDDDNSSDNEKNEDTEHLQQKKNGLGTSLLRVKNSDATSQKKNFEDDYVDDTGENTRNTMEIIKFLQQKNENLEKQLTQANEKYYEKKDKIKSKAQHKANKFVEDEIKRIDDEKKQSKEVKNLVQKELTKEELSKFMNMRII